MAECQQDTGVFVEILIKEEFQKSDEDFTTQVFVTTENELELDQEDSILEPELANSKSPIQIDFEPGTFKKRSVNKKFDCPFCSYVAKSAEYIANHVKAVHEKLKNFKCCL